MERPKMPDPERDEILDPKLEAAEREGLLETARLLEQERPVPRPAFRGALAKRLRPRSTSRGGLRFSSRQRLRLLIGAYAGSGLALLAVVAAGLGGIGPLAP
jgi:hypothetical protein